MEDKIILNKHLEPYFKMLDEEVGFSACRRAQFAAIIVSLDKAFHYNIALNFTISKCCDGICARTRLNLRHVERVEVGAEVHAETAALIDYSPTKDGEGVICLVGRKGAQELLGTDAAPCATCAVNLKYAGFTHIFMRDLDRQIKPFSLSEILQMRQDEWEPVD